jgi:hypothetical protein
MTVLDVMDKFNVDKPTAHGFIKFLEIKDLIVVSGSIKKAGVKGKGIYQYAFADNAADKLCRLLNTLAE